MEFNSKLEEFKKISTYVAGAYDEDSAFQELEKHMKEIEDKYEGDERNRLFYVSAFSVPSTSSRSSPI
jgi:glucose-6-phosphate 1-dehydrogenase